MKCFILILFNAGVLFNAAGQFIFTPKKPVTTNIETIDKHEGIQLKTPIPFSAIRIIDSRYDTTAIGFYLDGYLVLKDSSQPLALQHIINKYYGHLLTPGKDTLIIQLEKLHIQDEVMRDTGFIYTAGYAACKAYGGGNNLYLFLACVDTLMQEKYDYHTTFNAHENGNRLNFEFWDYYLLRLLEKIITGPFASKADTAAYLTLEQIKQTGLAKRTKPILLDSSLKPGFYRNFGEFANNNPTFVYDNKESLDKLLEVMHYRVGKHMSNEPPDTSYWGYCDGKKIFMRHNYDFYQLEKRDAGFYIAPTLDAKRREVNSSGLNLLIGLAVLSTGVAAKDGVSFAGFSALRSPNIPMVVLPYNGSYVLGLQLDLDTGEITF